MKISAKGFVTILLFLFLASNSYASIAEKETRTVDILWEEGKISGSIEVSNGEIIQIKAHNGKENKENNFRFTGKNPARLSVTISDLNINIGPEPTLITVKTTKHSFSFFLRDINKDHPIYIPEYNVIALPGNDPRSYTDIKQTILARKNLTKIQKIEIEPESSFESVAPLTRDMKAPIWLGLSRDIRIFEITEELEDAISVEDKTIIPRFATSTFVIPEVPNQHLHYRYAVGRGVGAKNVITRHLEDGVYPIYHSETIDDDIIYHSISFVSFEKTPLTINNVEGTDYRISDWRSLGRIFTKEKQAELDQMIGNMKPYTEEVVLYSRTEIENTGSVPRYAWVKVPRPGGGAYEFDYKTGFSTFSEERVFCVSRINGKPIPNQEVALLLQPGEKAQFDFFLPHEPIPQERAKELSRISFEEKHRECKIYWKSKQDKAATIKVPEKNIDERIKAGLFHLDLITYGKGDEAPLSVNVGTYSPIATENAHNIQFYASLGLKDIARRSLDYFIATQQEDGRIMNYFGYTVETGAALWSIGEYYRYFKDKEWIESIKPNLLKACQHLTEWRGQSKKEELRGKGYGMIDGKVADPEDHFHQFMLNGYGYMGMSRVAEMLEAIGAPEATIIKKEAENWKKDIRNTVSNTMAYSPVVPLGDGTWCPTLPPWAEAPGPRLLYQKRESFRSHGTFTVADAMLGPIYLVFCEILDPKEETANMILKYHSELMYQGNATFSQPYYSKHNWMQAKLGMVKPFLNTYYTTLSAHTDRDTYTFWEHMYRLSVHKTHEEGNFLMETRWMLYMEDGKTLQIFPTIPRKWMENDNLIELSGVQSYFGKLNIRALSHIDDSYIEASVTCEEEYKPESVVIRLPHPNGLKAVSVEGGEYDPETESVKIKSFNGSANIKVYF